MKGAFFLAIILTAHLVLAEEGVQGDKCEKFLQNVRTQLEKSKEPFDKMLDYACANIGESKCSELRKQFAEFSGKLTKDGDDSYNPRRLCDLMKTSFGFVEKLQKCKNGENECPFLCPSCKSVMTYVQYVVKVMKMTSEDAKKGMIAYCTVMAPENVCKKISERMEEIIEKLSNEMNPGNVCVELNLCDKMGGEGSLKKKLKNLFSKGLKDFTKHSDNAIKKLMKDMKKESENIQKNVQTQSDLLKEKWAKALKSGKKWQKGFIEDLEDVQEDLSDKFEEHMRGFMKPYKNIFGGLGGKWKTLDTEATTQTPQVVSDEDDDDDITDDMNIPSVEGKSQRAYDSPIWGDLWGTLKDKVEHISKLSPEGDGDGGDNGDEDENDEDDDEDETQKGSSFLDNLKKKLLKKTKDIDLEKFQTGLKKIKDITQKVLPNIPGMPKIPDILGFQSGIGCTVCKTIVGVIKIEIDTFNSTEEAIKNTVEKLCKLYPIKEMQDACDKIVEEVDQIIQLIEKDVDPTEICVEIKLCDKSDDQMKETVMTTFLPPAEECNRMCRFWKVPYHDNGAKTLVLWTQAIEDLHNTYIKIIQRVYPQYDFSSFKRSQQIRNAQQKLKQLLSDEPIEDCLCFVDQLPMIENGTVCDLCQQMGAGLMKDVVNLKDYLGTMHKEVIETCGRFSKDDVSECLPILAMMKTTFIRFEYQIKQMNGFCSVIGYCQQE